MGKKRTQTNETGETKVIRARLDHFTIYEVSDSELNALDHGTNSDVYLEFAIMCLSSAISITATMLSGQFIEWVLTLFVLIVIVLFIIGFLLLFLWHRHHKSRKDIISAIRGRLNNGQTDEEGATKRPDVLI